MTTFQITDYLSITASNVKNIFTNHLPQSVVEPFIQNHIMPLQMHIQTLSLIKVQWCTTAQWRKQTKSYWCFWYFTFKKMMKHKNIGNNVVVWPCLAFPLLTVSNSTNGTIKSTRVSKICQIRYPLKLQEISLYNLDSHVPRLDGVSDLWLLELMKFCCNLMALFRIWRKISSLSSDMVNVVHTRCSMTGGLVDSWVQGWCFCSTLWWCCGNSAIHLIISFFHNICNFGSPVLFLVFLTWGWKGT